MYSYSPIKSLQLKNFRNMADVELDFTESPIITLVGKNESGKTSIVKAFETCALHANPREQKDWIRDQTNMFGIQINLEDGTKIVRIKEDKGINLYRVIYPNGSHWEVTKLTEGLPNEVQKVMGLIEEPETKEYLHVRTYEDKLLFVVTPNSTNYKVMYNALKVEQLTKAIKIGSDEINELKSGIGKNDISIQTLNNQLKEITVHELSSLLVIRDRLKKQLEELRKIKKIRDLLKYKETLQEQLGAIAILSRFNMEPISELLVSKLQQVGNSIDGINKLRNKLGLLDKANKLEEIDTNTYIKLGDIIEKSTNLDRIKREVGNYTDIIQINEISEIQVKTLLKSKSILDKINGLKEQQRILSRIDKNGLTAITNVSLPNRLIRVMELGNIIQTLKNSQKQIEDYIVQVNEYLKSCGVAVETCPKCGEAVIFDIDKIAGGEYSG